MASGLDGQRSALAIRLRNIWSAHDEREFRRYELPDAFPIVPYLTSIRIYYSSV